MRSPRTGSPPRVCCSGLASAGTAALGLLTASVLLWLPVLLAYYVDGAAFLAFSSIAGRCGRTLVDGRSLSFLGGIVEGGETIGPTAPRQGRIRTAW